MWGAYDCDCQGTSRAGTQPVIALSFIRRYWWRKRERGRVRDDVCERRPIDKVGGCFERITGASLTEAVQLQGGSRQAGELERGHAWIRRWLSTGQETKNIVRVVDASQQTGAGMPLSSVLPVTETAAFPLMIGRLHAAMSGNTPRARRSGR